MINPKNPYGGSPLHLAFLFGHWNCVLKLVELGIDTSIKNKYGFTGLEVTVVLDQSEVLQQCIQLNSDDPNLSVNDENREKMLALALIHDARKCYEILEDKNLEKTFIDALNVVSEIYLKKIKKF